MKGRTGIACIGAGYWGQNLVRNFYELGALKWVCDTNNERLKENSTRYPEVKITAFSDQVLADPDVSGVAIATPAETHGELVRQALLAGKDVMVEKPICLSVDEGQRLVALAAERARILMVGHLLWYHPAILKLRDLVHSGELGRMQYVYSNRLNLGKIRKEENILWSFAPHDISVILGLIGEMPTDVQAHGGNYLQHSIPDVTVSFLSFPSGVKAHVFVSWLHPVKEQKLIVVGDRKMAVFDDLAPKEKLLVYPHSISWKNNIPFAHKAEAQPVAFEPVEPLNAECQHFIDCILTRAVPRTDGHEALSVLRVLDQCQRSLEEASSKPPVEVQEIVRPKLYSAHESAFIDEGVKIGEGTRIWHLSHVMRGSKVGKNCRIGQNVVIGPNSTVGNGCKIQNNVSVYEGVTLEDDVFCGPSMVFTNVYNPRSAIPRMDEIRPTLVRQGATLGANSTIMCGITIGRFAFVGAGAVVLKDVPDHALVVGNPGRVAGWMCECGNQIQFSRGNGQGICRSCQKPFVKMANGVAAR